MNDTTWDDIRETINKLNAVESAGDGWHINDNTTTIALEYTFLLEAIGANMPKIFSHGEDALVFT